MGVFAKVLVADGIAAIPNVLTTGQLWRYASTICAWSEICCLMDWCKVARKISVKREFREVPIRSDRLTGDEVAGRYPRLAETLTFV